MDRARAIAALPVAHATALLLDERGRAHDAAAALAIPAESVPMLLEVARYKLDELLAADDVIDLRAGRATPPWR